MSSISNILQLLLYHVTDCRYSGDAELGNVVIKMRFWKSLNPLKGRNVNWLHFAIQV